MKKIGSSAMVFFFAVILAAAVQFVATNAQAQSSYFTARGCTSCHASPVTSTCAGCHYHSGSLTATKNKTTSYSPGETVTITVSSSGARTGWVGVRLYDQSGIEIARSTGNQSGMGGSATFPAVLSAPAPTAAGNYTWRIAYVGNNNGTGTGDVHSEKSVNVSLTVASAADTTAPVVGTFTIPATATALNVPVSAFTATDNVGVTGYMITTSATAPAASATGWTASAPASVTAVAGSNTFYAWAKDATGNVSASRSATVVVTLPDTTAPVVGTFTIPATATALTVPVSAFTATDNVGVAGYMVTKSATAPAASATGWTASAPASVTAVAGSNTFYAWAKDAAGNVSASRSATVVVTLPDTSVPVVGTFTLPATATTLNVPVSALTSTDNVGVTAYKITTSAAAPAASAAGWTATAPTSVTAVAGSNTFYAWAKDAAGNVSASRSATVVVTLPDTSVPVVGTFTLPATATTLNVPVSAFTATDNVGVTGYMITTSATAPAASASNWSAAPPAVAAAPAAGNINFYAWAKDAAGNVSAAKIASVTITISTADTTSPALTVSTLANGSLTNKVTVNVSGNASDAGGLQSVTVNGEPAAVSEDGAFSSALNLVAGANTITVVAADKAGNRTTDSRTVTYDPAAPVLTVAAPADNSTSVQSFVTVDGNVNENSTVSITVNGGSRQSAAMTGTAFTATANLISGINTIDITATDLAGNTTSAKRTVTYSAPASQLTLAVTNPAQDVTTRKSTMTIKGKVADGLGKTKVAITVNGRTYSPKVSDTGSFSQRIAFSGERVRTYTIQVTAKDAAGNTATVTRNVIYRPYDDDDDDDHDD